MVHQAAYHFLPHFHFLELLNPFFTYVQALLCYTLHIMKTYVYDHIIQVNTNGVLSFRGFFTEYSPTTFPRTSFPLIAPFWQDFNIVISGHIFYRETTSPNQLQLASDIISSTFSSVPDDFNPAYLFVATWSNAAEFSGSSSVVSRASKHVLLLVHSRKL